MTHRLVVIASTSTSTSTWRRITPTRSSSSRRVSSTRAARAEREEEGKASSWTTVIDCAESEYGSDLLVERVHDDAPNASFAGCVVLTRKDAPDAVLSEYRAGGDGDEEAGRVGRGGVFDAFALLPALTTSSTTIRIGILGLGAGTCARFIASRHPEVEMIGWELDPAIVTLARKHFGVGDLEAEGRLTVRVGDAFAGCIDGDETFDGLIVDCFDENSTVVRCLKDTATWSALAERLKPGGRILANVSTGRGRGARLEDAVACAQALADATSGEVTLWTSGACKIWNELILSGPAVDWNDVARRRPDFEPLTKDWFRFERPADETPSEPWLAKLLGLTP